MRLTPTESRVLTLLSVVDGLIGQDVLVYALGWWEPGMGNEVRLAARNTLRQHIHNLRAKGYPIRGKRNWGYALVRGSEAA